MKKHKNAQTWKHIQAEQEKGHKSTNSGGNTHENEAQAHPITDHAKAV
jgi:hypothetical protein